MSLADKIRKGREQKVEVGGFTFVIRRPTNIEMLELRGHGSMGRMLPFIIGWEGVKELDIIPGGDPHPLQFDPDVCAEWMSDRPDLLTPLVSAMVTSYHAHLEKLGDTVKN